MTQLRHSIEIDRPVADVYDLARQVERYPEFMKDYLYSRIIQRGPQGDLVERAALVRGKQYTWKSLVTLRENEGVYFVHQEGPLHGMQVSWILEAINPNRTRLTITHRFQVKHAFPLWGRLQELWNFRPKINEIASRVVVSFKKACESRPATRAPRVPATAGL